MSVINKMLRDLDRRQAGDAGTSVPGERVVLGTLPVTALKRPHRRAWQPRAIWLVVLLVAAGVMGGWYWQSGQRNAALSVQADSVQVTQPAASLPARAPLTVLPAGAGAIQRPAAVVPTPAGLPALSTTTTPKRPAPVLAEPKISAKVLETPVKPPESLQKPATPRDVPPVAIAPDTATDTLRMESLLLRVPAPLSVTPKVPTQPAVSRAASLEVLAQAQSLWNAGSHTAATEVLGQALSRFESTTSSAAPVTSQSPMASVVRELARMQLADGQVSQALVLLRRLEPQLAQVAEVWAMRGNAAQRLGQHPEAAQSYLKALAFRPDEPRWLLGAAVSIAAQGQTVVAGELAEKARGMGALRPEVANYLRQLGVVIRTD